MGLYKIEIELTMGITIRGGLYYLQHTKIGNNTNKKDFLSSQWATLKTWVVCQIWLYHKRLRHPPFRLLKTMFPHLFSKKSVKSFNCDVYQFSKHYPATFSPNNNKSLVSFDLIHFDVWGLASNSILGSDNGTEFINLEFSKFLKDNSMVHELTCLNTLQTNGVVERKNRHLFEVFRALLF
ncbi:hypothetical protein CR513_02882, partial [Mucuna pruriens]